MKPEISYKLKIIGAKKLLAKTCVAKGWAGDRCCLWLQFLIEMCGKERLVLCTMQWLCTKWLGSSLFQLDLLGKSHEYLNENNPVIMGTRNNESHIGQYLNFRKRGGGKLKNPMILWTLQSDFNTWSRRRRSCPSRGRSWVRRGLAGGAGILPRDWGWPRPTRPRRRGACSRRSCCSGASSGSRRCCQMATPGLGTNSSFHFCFVRLLHLSPRHSWFESPKGIPDSKG